MLKAHFENLRAARVDAPVYLLEHGLSENKLAELLEAARFGLRIYAIDGGWWSSCALPLLVAASEVGYRYRGTGTDFWPTFTTSFRVEIQFDRSGLSNLFRQEAVKLGLAQPTDTPWTRAFCHIAWPILHSILPVELHRPLARVLRDVGSRLAVTYADDALIAPIRARAQLAGGVRLLAWLEDQRTAAAVIRYFLDPAMPPEIEEAALTRIVADLKSDEIASAALRDARKRQKALAQEPASRSRRRSSEAATRFALLALRNFGGHCSLAIKIPQMEQAERDAARAALASSRWRAFLWSQGPAVPGRNLFSDAPIPIAVNQLPSADTPLLAELAGLPLSSDAKQFLGGLRVKTNGPLLFSEAESEGEFVQQVSSSVTNSRHYVILISPNQPVPPASAENWRPVAGLQAYRINAGDSEIASWLGRLGITVNQAARISWLGAPELEQHRPIRRFLRGRFLALSLDIAGSASAVRLIDPLGTQSMLHGQSPFLFGFSPELLGSYTVEYGASEKMGFEIVDEADDEPLLKIAIDAGTGAISDLASRGVIIRFDSVASLQEATFELRLLSRNQPVKSALSILPDTPCRIDGDHPIWDALLSEDILERLLTMDGIDLAVTVRGLAQERFSFEKVMAPFGWENVSNGDISAVDETGHLALFTVHPNEPLRIVRGADSNNGRDVYLLRAGHDQPLETGSLCLGPKIWRASDAQVASKPERLLRQFESGRSGAADGRSLTDALIAWSAAGVNHPVTQFRRGQIIRQLDRWFVEQVCGAAWAQREEALAARRPESLAEAFLDACAEFNVGFANVELSADESALLRRILLRLIGSRGLPINLDTSRTSIDASLAAQFDDVFNDGYAILAQHFEPGSNVCPYDLDNDIDVGEESVRWDDALKAAASRVVVAELVDLLRPLAGADELGRTDFESLLPDDVVDYLENWITRQRPRHLARAWDRDLVQAAYWLFLKPAVAAQLSWRGASRRLLADRFSARAIRYAALRSGRIGHLR
jgi:hypothetical protein